MYLRAKTRYKDGKPHRYFSIVESRRAMGGRVIQKHVLYLGEINDSQRAAWCKSLEVFHDGRREQLAIFPEDRTPPPLPGHDVVQIRLSRLWVSKPRQWGACWLACEMWNLLRLDDFWRERLLPSREGTDWLGVFKAQVVYALLDHGSEWRLHRDWYGKTALADILGTGAAVSDDVLYRCLDRLLEHKRELFSFLRGQWEDLFRAGYDVLLYDLTSTYFECDTPESGKRKRGYSRDKRPDCVQVIIALIVTPEGFPLAYEVLDGNTSDRTTLPEFLQKIERQYGKAKRVWVMDRGVPTEKVLEEMRHASPAVSYLVGTSRGKLTSLEKVFLDKPWETAKNDVVVKIIEADGEVYVLAKSPGRYHRTGQMLSFAGVSVDEGFATVGVFGSDCLHIPNGTIRKIEVVGTFDEACVRGDGASVLLDLVAQPLNVHYTGWLSLVGHVTLNPSSPSSEFFPGGLDGRARLTAYKASQFVTPYNTESSDECLFWVGTARIDEDARRGCETSDAAIRLDHATVYYSTE